MLRIEWSHVHERGMWIWWQTNKTQPFKWYKILYCKWQLALISRLTKFPFRCAQQTEFIRLQMKLFLEWERTIKIWLKCTIMVHHKQKQFTHYHSHASTLFAPFKRITLLLHEIHVAVGFLLKFLVDFIRAISLTCFFFKYEEKMKHFYKIIIITENKMNSCSYNKLIFS